MGIFDSLTGKASKKAAEQQRMFLDQTRQQNIAAIDAGKTAALGNITEGYGGARDALLPAGDAINAGFDSGLGYLNAGAGAARTALDGSRGDLNRSISAYDPLSALGTKYGGATSLALNALGVNGAGGTAAARDAFMAGPAYNFNLEQGLEAINRRRNAGGMLDSGNADRDAQTFGAGLASQEYDKWLAGLLGFTNPELSATSGAATGQAQGYRSLADLGVRQADLETTLGQNQANLATGRAGMLADLAKTNAGTFSDEGRALAGINTGAANSLVSNSNTLAQPYANTYKQEADAANMASKNMIGLGMGVASLAAGGLGGLGGLGSLGSLAGMGGSSFAGLGGNPNMPLAGFDQSGGYFNYG